MRVWIVPVVPIRLRQRSFFTLIGDRLLPSEKSKAANSLDIT